VGAEAEGAAAVVSVAIGCYCLGDCSCSWDQLPSDNSYAIESLVELHEQQHAQYYDLNNKENGGYSQAPHLKSNDRFIIVKSRRHGANERALRL